MVLILLATAEAAPLSRALDRLLEDPALAGASVSILVGTPEAPVYARDPDRRLVPASTVKLVTAAAAVDALGPDHRFETVVAATGESVGTTLAGDLVVVGGFDPSFGDPDATEAGRRVAAEVARLGLARIEGDVVVDPSRGPGAPFGKGWMWDDLADPWSAPVGAANVAHNLAGEGTAACADRGGPGRPLVDPAGCLAVVVRDALSARGISVVGGAEVRAVPEAVEVARLSSASLEELLAHTLEVSDNLYAECAWLELGSGRPGLARDRVGALLARVGATDEPPVDGSGLSRYSHLSAATLVRVAVASPELADLLPIAGRRGTLAGRMVGTAAEGRVRAKTGSMTGVRNLVGFVDVPEVGPVPFAFLIDGLRAPQAEAIRVQDAFLATVAGARVTRGGRWRSPRSEG